MALLGVVGAEFSYSMRLEATAVRAWKDGITAAHLAEAGVEQAIREVAADSTFVGLDDQGVLTFYARDLAPLPRLPRDKVPLGAGHFSYRISDEEGRLNVNTATPERLDRLLEFLGLDKIARDIVVDSIQDWRDPDEAHRLNGAESDDYYLTLPVPYRSHNASLLSVNELLQIRGVTPTLFEGAEGKAGLADVVTVKTPRQVNINTAPEPVLRAYGLGDAEISQLLQARQNAPYARVPGQFGARGFSSTTRTFRIEADGLVDGQVRARITAVVQRRTDPRLPGGIVTILDWSGPR